jgi:hypothetical protein
VNNQFCASTAGIICPPGKLGKLDLFVPAARLASFDNNTVADHGHTVILYQDASPVWAAKYPPRVASAVFHQFLKVGRVVVQVREKLEID